MTKTTAFLMGAGLGAAAMYWWDPQQGKGRRTQIRDKGAAGGRRAILAVSGKAQDAANRLQGVAARIRQSTESAAETVERSIRPEG